jgi:glycosyltransferase involved in cell wall biosynthesis
VAEEILVVDSFSTDQTEAICREKGVRFLQHPFAGHIEQKNYALEQATYDHLLSLDADEALTDELRASILAAKAAWTHDGYRCHRLNQYCGHWVRHGAWYPDRKLRLWDRRKGRWGGNNPHDKVVMHPDASVGELSGDLLHYSVADVEAHLRQINFFTTIKAREAAAAGQRGSLAKGVAKAFYRFLRDYFFRSGWRDGRYGFMIAWNSAYAKLLEQMKLIDARRHSSP